jgi:hypothetical protein
VWTPTLTRIVVTPPPNAPPPAPTENPSGASGEAEIRGVIEAFVGALQRRDLNALAQRYPPRNAQWVNTWRRFYEEPRVRDLEARLDGSPEFRQDGATAHASFAVVVEFTDRDGRKRQSFEFEAEFQRGAYGWSMTAFTQKP